MPRNPYICITIVGIMGTVSVLGLVGIFVLALFGKQSPESMITIVAGAVGALSSFLVQVPRGSVGFDDPDPAQKT
jgi:hypothetical protein